MPGLLTLVDLAAHPERYQLIDARDAQDHATAHVEGAVHIPLLELAKRLAEISPDGTPCLLAERRTWRGAETLTIARQVFRGDAFDLTARFGPKPDIG